MSDKKTESLKLKVENHNLKLKTHFLFGLILNF
jgi:hypothetical protein